MPSRGQVAPVVKLVVAEIGEAYDRTALSCKVEGPAGPPKSPRIYMGVSFRPPQGLPDSSVRTAALHADLLWGPPLRYVEFYGLHFCDWTGRKDEASPILPRRRQQSFTHSRQTQATAICHANPKKPSKTKELSKQHERTCCSI